MFSTISVSVCYHFLLIFLFFQNHIMFSTFPGSNSPLPLPDPAIFVENILCFQQFQLLYVIIFFLYFIFCQKHIMFSIFPGSNSPLPFPDLAIFVENIICFQQFQFFYVIIFLSCFPFSSETHYVFNISWFKFTNLFSKACNFCWKHNMFSTGSAFPCNLFLLMFIIFLRNTLCFQHFLVHIHSCCDFC